MEGTIERPANRGCQLARPAHTTPANKRWAAGLSLAYCTADNLLSLVDEVVGTLGNAKSSTGGSDRLSSRRGSAGIRQRGLATGNAAQAPGMIRGRGMYACSAAAVWFTFWTTGGRAPRAARSAGRADAECFLCVWLVRRQCRESRESAMTCGCLLGAPTGSCPWRQSAAQHGCGVENKTRSPRHQWPAIMPTISVLQFNFAWCLGKGTCPCPSPMLLPY